MPFAPKTPCLEVNFKNLLHFFTLYRTLQTAVIQMIQIIFSENSCAYQLFILPLCIEINN
jgi:hypothetical protein